MRYFIGDTYDIPAGNYVIGGKLRHVNAGRWTITSIYTAGNVPTDCVINNHEGEPVPVSELDVILEGLKLIIC